ncbi:carboxylic acid reductase [Actinokineospora spheciospongiae]|uniref:carboxylic acid reductase n=1 Tax=Actinokineospora spheciospongiae TaxID=909613 RepID=UPI000D717F95|nr:carboxylic acid reductase [Actinokineospora spheciospongiae]PWW63149.1 fatty acid CoA ligase FadD9 [Actinokineospora spheciospongiae]
MTMLSPSDTTTDSRAAALRANDDQVRGATPLAEVEAVVGDPGVRLAPTLEAVMTGYADRPAIGERVREPVRDPATGRTTARLAATYRTTTYGELWASVTAVAAELAHDAANPLRAGDFVAVLGFTSGDYTTIDLACLRSGAVVVPLQAGAPAGQLAPIVTETAPKVLATSVERIDTAVEVVLTTESVRRVVVFDHRPEVDDERAAVEAARRRLAEAGSTVTVDPLVAVRERGAALPAPPVFTPAEDEDPLALLVYTSGSTGAPKGAMYPERLVKALFGWSWSSSDIPSLGFNFMPMSHLAGRVALYGTFVRGGIAHFTARSDLSTLFEDIALVRPTELLLVPRVCDMLFQRYQSEVDRLGPGSEDAVKADLRENFLGGRVLHATVGTAPISAEMSAFVSSVLGIELHDGYGSTEAGGLMMDHRLVRPPVLDYKLVDVPELGYFTTDTPHPRGELLVKTATIIPGYYKRPDVTAEVFDEDGFYRTGDIMAETAPDTLHYVDRRKNVLKLSQGEFVAVSHLEAVFASSPLVRQIYVHGSSERAYLLAVVVPTDKALAAAGGDAGALKALLAESLQQVGRQAELNSYEVPRDLVVETEPFSNENGLLSDVRKLLRPRLKERYGERLEQLYRDLAQGEVDGLRALRGSAGDRPVLETVGLAAAALLGRSGAEISPEAHFTDLGGDSLSALSFSNLLHETFGVQVPVSVIVSAANDLRGIARHIEAARESGTRRPTAASVHGVGATRVRATDLTLDKFIDARTLAEAPGLPRPTGTPTTVLLTGANGYLGRFLCLVWLERLAATGGKLVCVVRGSDAEAARARLDAAFDSGDADLLAHYRRLAAEHLEVVAGDIGEPDLGLDEPTWERLADGVDLIVHPAALVNHVLPYDQLFGPNVVGTAELIRMAITSRVKPFVYLSTVAVVEGREFAEDADVRVASPERPIDDSYANGYANSKWAGEVLLREAHDAVGLPVRAFRSDMILAHSRYTGQLNVPDMFTRLLFSVLTTGLAPRSFYRTDGDRPRAHYDGLPADFTAESITALGAGATEGHATFNVLNPHEDGLSLDVFVDWLVDVGHPIQRIDDYAEWIARLETALRALPEKRRQHSLLPLLHAFAHPAEPVDGSHIPAALFHEAVRAEKIGPEQDIPHLSAALITKYADDLKGLGIL